MVLSDVFHPHPRARKHVLLVDVPLNNIIIKYEFRVKSLQEVYFGRRARRQGIQKIQNTEKAN